MSSTLLTDNFNSALNISQWILCGDTLNADNFATQISNLTNLINNVTTVPTGTILDFASITPPTSYLNCDGSAISRTTYSNLFAVIGTNYGSNNGTDFKLPNLQGRVTAGYSVSNSNLSFAGTIGNTFGEQNHTLIVAEMPSHTHSSAGGVTGGGTGNLPQGFANNGGYTVTLPNTGSDGSHNNTQPTLILNKIIRI
jgi:microcystin-dependent protein